MKAKIYRVLDANHNRGKEALRVCEDVARFVLDHKGLAGRFKQIRHEVTKALLSLPVSYRYLVSVRDAQGDVGRKSHSESRAKQGYELVFARNIRRAEEATRVLEEFSKTLSIKVAKRFQRLRFKLYELEKETFHRF